MGTGDRVSDCRRVRAAGSQEHGRILAEEPIGPGEVVLRLGGALRSEPTQHSIQVGLHQHLDPGPAGGPAGPWGEHPWRYLNHGCEPNARVAGLDLVAVRPIASGEEVTFNYNATEWRLASPFTCWCGAPDCAGAISGFQDLSPAERERLRPLLSDHLLAHLPARPPSAADGTGA